MVSQDSSSPELLQNSCSTPFSAESNFRQLDDAFLQSQTRIWIGQVLNIRLDEELVISELLADGELLFFMSKVVWRLLLAKHMDLRHVKSPNTQPFASERNSGRYRPYSNVDSFLKICKILGLTGVDLFSPSDVVERRNTRRVCMCIRSFSKKLRSMNIEVPDFDNVTCVVAMPKDVVDCMRRSIELSRSHHADWSGFYVQKPAGRQPSQGYSVTDSIRDWETYSDQFNDMEIKHPTHQFNDLQFGVLYDYSSEINYNVPSPIECDFKSKDSDQLDGQSQQSYGISNDELQLLCSRESSQYPCSDNIEHDCKLTWSSSPYCGELHIDFSGAASGLDTKVLESRNMDFEYFENDSFSDNIPGTGTPMNDKMQVIRDVSSRAKVRKDHDLLNEEDITANVHKSGSSHGSSSTPQTFENGRCFEIGEDMEALHEAGTSCLSKEAETWNLGDQFDAEENDLENKEYFKLSNENNHQWDTQEEYESQDITEYKEMACGINSNARNSYFDEELAETEQSLYSPNCFLCKTDSSNKAILRSSDKSSKQSAYDRCSNDNSSNQSEELLPYQSYSLPEFCKWDQKGKCAMTSSGAIDNNSYSGFLEDGLHEETTHFKQKTPEIFPKAILSCIANKDDAVCAAVVKSATDSKELKNDCQALASNAPYVDDSEKCLTIGNDIDNFYGKGVADRGNGVLDIVVKDDVVAPANCDKDVPFTESCISNQCSQPECNNHHQAFQYDMDPVYDSEQSLSVLVPEEINPEDKSMHSFEISVEAGERIVEMPKAKQQKKLLLKSVFGGAAAVGLLFMFLHLRRNGDERGEQTEPSKQFDQRRNEKIQKYSHQKVKKRSTAQGAYPAENLILK